MSIYGHAQVVLDDPTEEEWAKARHQGIGGSEIAAVLGLSEHTSNVEVWARKVNEADEWEGNEAADLGKRFEDPIALETCRRLDLETLGPPYSRQPGQTHQAARVLLQHPEHPWLMVTPDRICQDADGQPGPLEIKMTAGPKVSDDWQDDERPLRGGARAAVLQCIHQMLVTGHHIGWVGALVGGYGHRVEVRTVEWDQGLADMLVNELGEFWSSVEAGVPPAPKGPGSRSVETIRGLFDALDQVGAQEIDGETMRLVDALAEARATATQARKDADDLQAEIGHRLLLAESDVGLVDGAEYVTWRPQTSTRLDQAAVKEAHPDWKDRFGKETTTRVMRTPRKAATE